MNKERKKELLDKFASRTLNPEELEEFWGMIGDGAHQELLEEDLSLDEGDDADFIVADEEMESSIAAVKHRLNDQIQPQKGKGIRRFSKIIQAAAAVLLVFAGIKSYQHFQYIQDTQTYVIVNVPVGKIQKIYLSDSSSVTIASGSVFKYPKAFSKNERVVYLTSGRAFFKVAGDRSRPFSVKSGELSTTALGTSFTVQYNAKYKWEKVSLYTGKVVIKRTDTNTGVAPVFLTPGKAYELNGSVENSMSFNVAEQPPLNDKNSLLFMHTPFHEAVYQIASYYHINIDFNQKSTGKYTVNGDFSGQTKEEALQSLVFIHQLKFIKSDSLTYKLMKK